MKRGRRGQEALPGGGRGGPAASEQPGGRGSLGASRCLSAASRRPPASRDARAAARKQSLFREPPPPAGTFMPLTGTRSGERPCCEAGLGEEAPSEDNGPSKLKIADL